MANIMVRDIKGNRFGLNWHHLKFKGLIMVLFKCAFFISRSRLSSYWNGKRFFDNTK